MFNFFFLLYNFKIIEFHIIKNLKAYKLNEILFYIAYALSMAKKIA